VDLRQLRFLHAPRAGGTAMSRARSRVFRYGIDAVSVLVVLLALGLQLAAFLLELPWFTLVPIVVLMRWTPSPAR
jgi:hypothetical protein